jgi:pilus assembly protein CpaD
MKPVRILHVTLACLLFAGLAGCFKSPIDMPHQSVITSDGNTLTPPDCSDLQSPSELTDAGLRRPSVAWGCATYTNLAAQIAHPEHFNHPVELGPADAAMAASAVHRYENGKAEKVDTSSTREASK